MTEKSGLAKTKKDADGNLMVYLRLDAGETCILQTNIHQLKGNLYAYAKPAGDKQEIKGTWTLTFKSGGPVIPGPVQLTELSSWTNLTGDDVKKFSGSASYSIRLEKPVVQAPAYMLDLGEVGESAEIKLNGSGVATLIGPTHRTIIPAKAFSKNNLLEIIVTNGMANRIADMDRNNIPWKKFYNVNFPARLATNRDTNGLFNASKWIPKESGLIGPVTITPMTDDIR